MAEIDNLEIVVTAETGDVDSALKQLQQTIEKFTSSLSNFGKKMDMSGVSNKMKSVTKSFTDEQSRINQIAREMADDFIKNFNIDNDEIKDKVQNLSQEIMNGFTRQGLKVTGPGANSNELQKELVDTVLGHGKIYDESIADRKARLQEFYDDLIKYYQKFGAINLPDGIKSPSFEGAPVTGKMFKKGGNDLTQSNFIHENYTDLFSQKDLENQEDIINRIIEITKEYRSITATVPLGDNEIKYMLDQITDSAQKTANVLMEPIKRTNELKKKFQDWGKDWEFKGTVQEAQTNLKALEKQLENAIQKKNGLILKDRINSNAYEDAIANIQLLTNKIEILKEKINSSKVELQDMSNVPINRMNPIEENSNSLEEYIDLLDRLAEKLYSGNLNGSQFIEFGGELKNAFEDLKRDYPESKDIVESYETLIEEYNGIRTEVFPKSGVGDFGSYEREMKEKTESLRNSISMLKKESMELSSTISKQKGGGYSKAFVEMEKEIKKTMNTLAQLQSQMLKGLTGKGNFTETEKFKLLDQQIKDTSTHLETLKSELSNIPQMEVKPTGQSQGLLTQLKSSDILVAFRKELLIVAAVIKSVEKAAKGLWKVLKAIGRGIKAIGSALLSPFRKLHTFFKSLVPTSGLLTKSLMRNWKMFRLMIARSILRGIINLGKEGFQNLVQYSNECNKSFSMLVNSTKQLGNSVAAMVSPLLNALAPALNQIIQLAIRAVNAINQVLSALTGRGTWIKAKNLTDDYAKSLGSVNKQLASLDELNNLTSGGSGSGTSASDMFETLPIEKKWEDLAKKIKGILEQLFEPLNAAWEKWEKPFQASYKYMLSEIKGLIESIGRDWLRVWSEANTQKIFENIIIAIGNIQNGIGNIAKNIRIAWDSNDNGYNILVAIRDVILLISEKAKLIAQDFSRWTQSLNFEPLLEKLGPFIEKLEGPIGFLTEAFRTFIRDVLEPLGKWVLEEGLPDLLDILTNLMDNIEWDTLNGMLSTFWTTLEKFGEKVGQGLIDFISDVSEGIQDWLSNGGYEKLQGWLEDIESWMDNTSSEDITRILNDAFSAITKVATGIGSVVGWITKLMAGDSLGGLYDRLLLVKKGFSFMSSAIVTVVTCGSNLSTTLQKLQEFVDSLSSKISNWIFGKKASENMDQAKSSSQKFYDILKTIFDFLTPMQWSKRLGEWAGTFITSFDDIKKAAENIAPSLASGGSKLLDTFNTGRTVNGYNSAGFPSSEEGWFRSSHEEYMGRFDNGQSYVANNEQIVSGIEIGVANAVSSVVGPYLNSILNNTSEIANKDISVSTDGIFKSVRNSAYQYSRRTGKDAFGF